MIRKAVPALALAIVFGLGCAGPSKLAQVSEDKLARGDMWRAWTLATRALDRAPANPRAREAAAAAAGAIAADWRRRLHAAAEPDTPPAADQLLQFMSFRAAAARYT